MSCQRPFRIRTVCTQKLNSAEEHLHEILNRFVKCASSPAFATVIVVMVIKVRYRKKL